MTTKRVHRLWAAAIATSLLAQACWTAPSADPNGTDSVQLRGEHTTEAPSVRIAVDARIELISLIFRLAGNPEYTQGRVASYSADVEKQFGEFGNHPVVTLARQLRASRGVSYDACMSMAVHLADADELKLRLPLAPWPEALDRRWSVEGVSGFLAAARQFMAASSFRRFFDQHRSLYATTESRLRKLIEQEAHLEWFREYFGERPQAAFIVVPALLNGGACYGPRFRGAAAQEELYCILGVWKTDAQGLPEFARDMLSTIVHEFCHSYANAIIDRHEPELRAAGEKLYRNVATRMQSQAYGNAQTMLRESLVRACVVRYLHRYDGAGTARKAIQEEKRRGFMMIEGLSDLLGQYEEQRDRYPTLESFAPRLVSFCNRFAEKEVQVQGDLAARRPKVVSMTPANGATDVDPAQGSITVTFDRPMRDRSWSLVGGGPHCPETTGRPAYDGTRTTWTVPVKLKPGWDYEFWLNSESYDAFRSAEGVPLEPVHVEFKTGKNK